MPLVDLRCKKCLHEYESFVKMKEKHNKKCPNCGKRSVERLISGGVHAFVKDIKTLGQLAEQNVKKKGKYHYDPSLHAPRSIDPDLINATKEELDKYIETGKRPPERSKKNRKEKLAEIKELRKQK